jgi:hypothetical protein
MLEYAKDIKSLFRSSDVDAMKRQSLDLGSYIEWAPAKTLFSAVLSHELAESTPGGFQGSLRTRESPL